MEDIVQQKIIKATQYVENQLDDEIAKLDNLDVNDFEKLRENRLKELKKQHQLRQNWISLGHGEYSELTEEKEFFEVSKKSERVVCLFYRNDCELCKILDYHLKILAARHLEAKFCKLNSDRCPFLIGRLKIKTVPIIALIVDNKIKDYIVGFSDCRNGDNISMEVLEYRISQSGAITCHSENAEDFKRSGMHGRLKLKTIRGRNSNDSDDDI